MYSDMDESQKVKVLLLVLGNQVLLIFFNMFTP